jgi:hypothetical protein
VPVTSSSLDASPLSTGAAHATAENERRSMAETRANFMGAGSVRPGEVTRKQCFAFFRILALT